MTAYHIIVTAFGLLFILRGFKNYREAMIDDVNHTHFSRPSFSMVADEDGKPIIESKNPKIWMDDSGLHEVDPTIEGQQRYVNYYKQLDSKVYRRLFFLEYTCWSVMLPWSIFSFLVAFMFGFFGLK